MGYLYIAATVIFTVYGQLTIKWRVDGSESPEDAGKFGFISQLLMDPWVLSAFAAAGVASVTWMLAVSYFPISKAYPFMSAAFGLVLIGSALFFAEPLTVPKVLGVFLIAAGIVVGAQG